MPTDLWTPAERAAAAARRTAARAEEAVHAPLIAAAREAARAAERARLHPSAWPLQGEPPVHTIASRLPAGPEGDAAFRWLAAHKWAGSETASLLVRLARERGLTITVHYSVRPSPAVGDGGYVGSYST